jgi:CHAD domain-containing protein
MAKAKIIEGLRCKDDAAQGIRMVLATRFQEMVEQRDAALDWSDPEGVHDMRVASRRLRSALRDFKPYLRKRRIKVVTQRIADLAGVLGEVRDHDVAIGSLHKMMEEAPAGIASGIERLVAARSLNRAPLRERLVGTLNKASISHLETEFKDALEVAIRERPKSGKNRSQGFAEFGVCVINHRATDFQHASYTIYSPLDQDRLHRLRIIAKRLRYSLDLFAQCHGSHLHDLARGIAEIQGELGELHDCDLWIQELGSSFNNDDDTGPATNRFTETWLLGQFAKQRATHYGKALEHFAPIQTRIIETLEQM